MTRSELSWVLSNFRGAGQIFFTFLRSLLGTPEEKAELSEVFGRDPEVRIAAGLGFGAQMAIVKKSELIITPDTSWVHVPSAFEPPLVVIYRREDPAAATEFPSLVWAGHGLKKRAIFAVGRADYKGEVDASTFSEAELQQVIEALSASFRG